MYSDKEFFIGAMLWRLVRNVGRPLVVEMAPGHSDVLFVNRRPLYVKIATNRKSPWQFTFTPENLECISKLREANGECVVVLICGHDGDVSLAQGEFSQVVDLRACRVEWIRVGRGRGEQYRVGGSFGKLTGKIPVNSLSRKFS